MASMQQQQTAIAVKKPGPPVPPRPQHTIAAATTNSAAASLLKTQRESVINATTTNRFTATTSATSSDNNKITVAATNTTAATAGIEHPVIRRKPTTATTVQQSTQTVSATAAGRTIIYKSPSMHLPKKPEERETRTMQSAITTDNITIFTNSPKALANGSTSHATRPPLKLRKAPDVPTTKPKAVTKVESFTIGDANGNNRTQTETQSPSRHKLLTQEQEQEKTGSSTPQTPQKIGNKNIVILQQNVNGVNLNRHHSMGSPKPTVTALKETRLSLGRADFEKVACKIQLDQLQPGQPLPKPRKIVKMPVATLDVDEQIIGVSNSSAVNIFRRSKTTLDNLASRANVTTISTGNSSNGFLCGKTVEIKNNLKNVAERLFSEIIVNQQKPNNERAVIITKHERAIQHQALLEQELLQERQKRLQQVDQPVQTMGQAVSVVSTASEAEIINNCTRININAPIASNKLVSPAKSMQNEHIFNSTEKKTAFHEMLISELAAMRTRSSSMENLHIKDTSLFTIEPNEVQLSASVAETIPTAATAAITAVAATGSTKTAVISKSTPIKTTTRKRCNSLEDQDPDTEDVDADNIEDAEGDEDDLSKAIKTVVSNNTPRKRSPSGCSSDSSPYGTERSARIRTSDWIEVGDNGKQVTLTSCHISLEDSGLEDEERLDEMSSSGVGDSWDSVKEAEHAKRCRSVKRVMSITDLPPLPKSLSGINKMLGSDSGLISDADTNVESNNLKLECQKDNSSKNSSNSNNNIIKYNSSNVKNNTRGKDRNDDENEIENNNKEILNESNGNAVLSESTKKLPSNSATSGKLNITKIITKNTILAPPTPTECTLDTQLAILKKEMYGLRQLDLSLLSQLWALNDSIQEFRTMIEQQEDEEPESYSRTPSSYDSASSDAEDELSNGIKKHASSNAKIITTQPKLMKSKATENAQHSVVALVATAASVTASHADCSEQNTTNTDTALQQQKPPVPKPPEARPVPRMRSAPPPPPTARKAAAPPRPT